jgi:DNA-binding LytR/AlgR family response regulator
MSVGLRAMVVDDGGGAGLAALFEANQQVAEVHSAVDAMGALRLLRSVEIDAVFTVVELPGVDGLDLARILDQFVRRPTVIMVADDGRRAVEAFDVGAVDYLLRPVSPARLAESLRRVARVRHTVVDPAAPADPAPTTDEQIHVTLSGVRTSLAVSSVRWMEAHRGYTRLHTAGGSHPVLGSLMSLATAWADDGFVQIHRGYAVRATAVSELRKVGSHLSVVVDGQKLPVSRRYGQRVRQLLLAGIPIRDMAPRPHVKAAA